MTETTENDVEARLRERTQEVDGEVRISCEQALALAAELAVPPATIGALCDRLGIKLRHCQLNCF